MKTLKKLLVVLLVAALSLTTACGSSFDAKGFVESFMTLLTQGDVKDYAEFTGESEDEALEEYQALADSIKTMVGTYGASDETQERIANVYLEVIGKAKYTVKDAVSTDEGYDVDIDIEPIVGLYDGMMEELQTEFTDAYNAGEVEYADSYDWIFGKMADKMEEKMDSLTYGDAQTVTVHLVKEDNTYKIQDETDLGEQIGTLLIDQSGLTG